MNKTYTPRLQPIGRPLPVSYEGLMLAFRKRDVVTLVDHNNRTYSGVINSIQAEDGSGNNYNVTVTNGMDNFTVFVRVI